MADTIPGCSPACPVPNLKEDVVEIKEGLKSLHDKQDKMIELSVHMVNMQRSIDKQEEKDIRDKKNIYERLSTLESNAITKKDLTMVIAIIGLIFTAISIGVNILFYVLK
jgi:hypothetical protein